MNDLQIIVSQQPGVIATNFEDIKEKLLAQMVIYKELEVTEENKAERKKDIATLRKMIKAVNDKRIEVKRECLKPYDAYEKLSSELVDIINEPIGIIDNQVTEFEEAQRIKKLDEIRKTFDLVVVDYPTLIDEIGISVIYDNRWENISSTLKSIKEDMISKLNTIRDNVSLISSMVSDKAEEALKLFWGDLDVAKAITMINRYEAQKKEIETRVAEQQKIDQSEAIEREVERARKSEREAIERERQFRQAEHEAMVVKQSSVITEKRLYGIDATDEEFEQIEMYFNSLGLSFERI